MNCVMFQAKERISHMEEVDRLMVSESQSTQARNTLLKNQLQKLKGKSVRWDNHATSSWRTSYRVNKVNHSSKGMQNTA